MDKNSLVVVNGEISVVAEVLSKYTELKQQRDKLDKEIKDIESQLKSELKELVSETTKVGNFTYVVSGGFYTYEFDLDLLKREQPLTYLQYLKPKQSKETCALRFGKAK